MKRSEKQLTAAATIDGIYETHPYRQDYPLPEEAQTFLVDFLCDLQHWADVNSVSFETALNTADMHFQEESNPEYTA